MSAFFYSLYYKFFALFASVLMLISPSFRTVMDRLETDKQYQLTHIEELKAAYADGSRTKCDESAIFSGSYSEMLSGGTKLNELTVIGTHNSYQRYSGDGKTHLSCTIETQNGVPITLSDQLDAGLRNLEIDIETIVDNGETSFVCIHSPVFDMATNCYSFEKALEELAVWSDNNPGHLPVSIIIEPKAVFIPLENMEFFSLEAAKELDKTLRTVLGDRLLTPGEALGSFDSFKSMREADGWKTVEECLGKIAVILHPCKVTDDYINIDPTIKTQSMFPMVRAADKDKPYAAFLLINDAKQLLKNSEKLAAGNYIIRTRADLSGMYSADTFASAAASAANIISTDYPYLGTDTKNTVSFDGFKMVKTIF